MFDPTALPSNTKALLQVSQLETFFAIHQGLTSKVVNHVKAVNNVSFEVYAGEVLGLVGESGSGKTTLGRSVLRLIEPTGGNIVFDGQDVRAASSEHMRSLRKRMQIIFQDPFASLNPRMTVQQIVAEPLSIHKLFNDPKSRKQRVAQLLELVGLNPDYAPRYPHEFSGGQRQRIGIARALAVEPDFIVADEPVSALDVSIQAQVVNLLQDLKKQLGLTMLFIAHDLAVVEHISDRIAVMYLGKIMEIAPAKRLYRQAQHPYTKALLSAIPTPDPTLNTQRIVLKGDIPSPINPPSGCVFRTRCSIATERCAQQEPPMQTLAEGHHAACFYPQ